MAGSSGVALLWYDYIIKNKKPSSIAPQTSQTPLFMNLDKRCLDMKLLIRGQCGQSSFQSRKKSKLESFQGPRRGKIEEK